MKEPTRPQRALLRDLAAKPGRYVRDRFDLGGCELKEADGSWPRHPYPLMMSYRGPTVEACFIRGWVTYTVHRYGGLTEIERRYVITAAGREVIA